MKDRKIIIRDDAMRISTYVRSLSHELNKEAFSMFSSNKGNIAIDLIKKSSFRLTAIDTIGFDSINNFAPVAHYQLSIFIMALNAATIGHFINDMQHLSKPTYVYKKDGHSGKVILGQIKEKYDLDISKLQKKEMDRCAIIYGGYNKIISPQIYEEYIKGMLHLNSIIFDMNFNREAFNNFYRAFEYLATNNILKRKKLKNELKELQEALDLVNVGDLLKGELPRLYRIRCEQIMHAQKEPKKVDIDDVFKAKGLADLIINRIAIKGYKEHIKTIKLKA